MVSYKTSIQYYITHEVNSLIPCKIIVLSNDIVSVILLCIFSLEWSFGYVFFHIDKHFLPLQ